MGLDGTQSTPGIAQQNCAAKNTDSPPMFWRAVRSVLV
jgi:hypothetical protein